MIESSVQQKQNEKKTKKVFNLVLKVIKHVENENVQNKNYSENFIL